MSDTLHLTLLRHGSSRADDEQVHEGRYDSPLTAEGLRQVRALAAYWQANPPGFGRVLCSTLVRARETAEIVSEALGLTPEPREDWREFDNGPLAGLPFAEAERRYPRPAFRHRFEPYTSEGGESGAQFEARVLRALHEVWTCGEDRVLVVAHGGVLNVALRQLLGAPRDTWFAYGDTGFATLRLSRGANTTVLTGVGLQPHLSQLGT